nr:hypothetical protein [Tanacetum cinerariifolium]
MQKCKQKSKGGNYYEFFHNTRSVKPTILHFQLRNLVWATSKHDVYLMSNYSIMHWSSLSQNLNEILNFSGHVAPTEKYAGSLLEGFTQTQISTLAVNDGFLKLDKKGVSFCTRTTYEDNAITNAIEIYNNVSGGMHFMASNNDCGVREYDMEGFQLVNHFRFPWPVNTVATVEGHLDYSFASAWHPDGKIFATGNQDKTCRVWDIRNLSDPVSVLKGNMGAVRSVRFSSDGQFLVVAEPADFVHVYNTNLNYEKRQEIDFFGEISGVSLSPDDETLYIGVWDRTYASLLQFNKRHKLCFLQDDGACAPRGCVRVLGLGQLFIVWSGLATRVKLYVIMSPQSSVSFVRAEDIARLRSAQLLTVSGLVCVSHTLLGSSTSVVKDPLPIDEAVDLPCVELLNENRTIIRKYPDVFLCLVGLSRSFPESDVHSTLLRSDDEGRVDFVNSADPFKVKTGERTLAENKVPLLTKTEDRVISSSPQTITLFDHTIHDEVNVNVGKRKKRVAFVSGSPPMKKPRTEGIIISDSQPSIAGKSPTALRKLIRQSGKVDAGSGSVVLAAEDITSSFVTPTPERAPKDDLCDNVRTHHPSGRFVVLSSSSANTNIFASSQVVTHVSSAPADVSVPVIDPAGLEAGTRSVTLSQGTSANDFYESQTVDSATALNMYIPNWNIINSARIDNHATCRSLLDHVTPPGYWAALRNQGDAGFLDAFNINYAQHICMASELRLHYEHEIMTREKFERKFTDSAAIVQQRDAEVANLNTQNVGLLEKVSTLELVHEELDGKVSQLIADCDGLRSRVAGEDKMREEFVSQQDAAERRFAEQAAELDARIADCARFVECCFALGKVISMAINKGIQQGLEAGIAHGKEGRSLTQIEAYDPEVEEKYVVAVFAFENVSFPLLDELEGLKDSPLAFIMSALTLKDDHGDANTTPEFRQFQPSLDQVTVPIYSKSGSIDHEMLLSDAIPAIRGPAARRRLCPPPSSTMGGASGSAPPHESLGVANYQVSTLVLSVDEGSTTQPPVVQAHDDLFDTPVLDGACGT